MPSGVHNNHRRKLNLYTVDSVTGCWNWVSGFSHNGYGKHWADGKTVSAHRYFYEQNIGPIHSKNQIDHLCKNRKCVNPSHLEQVSCAENIRRSAVVKLNWDIVGQIRALYANGMRNKTHLGLMFQTTRKNISKIVNYVTWA